MRTQGAPTSLAPSVCGSHIVIYGTALLSVMGVASILPVLPAMGRHFDLSPAELGVLIFSFTLPGIFLAPVGGILADRLGRKAVLIPCLLLFALGGLICVGAASLQTLLIGRVIQGCGAACLGVLYNTIIGDIFLEDHARLRVMGYGATALSLGAAVFPAVGGILGEAGWRWPFLLPLLAVPLAWVTWRTPLPAMGQRSAMLDYARQMRCIVMQKRTLEHFGITLCAFAILYGPMITYFPLYANLRFDASPLTIGMLFAVGSLGTALAAAFLGRLALVIPARQLVLGGSIFFTLSMLCMFLAGHMEHALWLCAFPVLFYGLGQGLAYPSVMTSLSALAPPEGRGVLMAVNGTILRMAQTLSPALCGLAFAALHFDGVYALGLGLGAAMLLLARHAFNS